MTDRGVDAKKISITPQFFLGDVFSYTPPTSYNFSTHPSGSTGKLIPTSSGESAPPSPTLFKVRRSGAWVDVT